MQIFDQVERSDTDYSSRSELEFRYLNRSAREEAVRVRDVLESWFSRYPAVEQSSLRARLLGSDAVEAQSAFFELYLHELMTRLGYTLETHPVVPGEGKRPDFLATRPGGSELYLEAKVARGLSADDSRAEKLKNEVYDTIAEIESPNFFIGLRLRGAPNSSVPRRRLLEEIAAFIEALNPDECTRALQEGGIDALPSREFTHDGWDIEYFASPKVQEVRGSPDVRSLGALIHDVRIIDPRADVRDAIKRKASRYGKLDKPYFVAVNAASHHLRETDAMEALFGKEQIIFPSFRIERVPDGALVGPNGPKNTRVSGILLVSSLNAWSAAAWTPVAYHNPWAERPFSSAFDSLPKSVPAADERMEFVDGTEIHDILGLPRGWPL
jgi:hypothetical protein